MPKAITKKGKNPENKAISGMIKSDSFSEKTKFVKNKIDITITKIILGINEDMVKPYSDDISSCFLLGSIAFNLTFNMIMDIISPMENTQNVMWIACLKNDDVISLVIDCSQ